MPRSAGTGGSGDLGAPVATVDDWRRRVGHLGIVDRWRASSDDLTSS